MTAGTAPRRAALPRPQRPADRVPRGRLLLLVGGGLGLLAGLWTGLARAGMHDPAAAMGAHGILMVLGFLGTLIGLERAVAIRRRWAYLGPACTALSVPWLVLGLPPLGAGLLVTAGGLVVGAAYLWILRQRVETHLVLMAGGAAAWIVAAALWTAGWSAPVLSPTLAAFLVLTIVGERLELSRLRTPSAASRRRLLAAVAVFALGVAVTLVARRTGLIVAGVGLTGQALWLWRNDLARVTVHRDGVARFAAVCLLSGYVWLAASGVLWVALGFGAGGLVYDAALHALFLGFVMSMVMGHAPIILPAVLHVPLPHHPSAWVPLWLLHASVALRVGADLAGSAWLRGWTTHGNVAALLLFVALSALTVRRARRGSSAAAVPS